MDVGRAVYSVDIVTIVAVFSPADLGAVGHPTYPIVHNRLFRNQVASNGFHLDIVIVVK